MMRGAVRFDRRKALVTLAAAASWPRIGVTGVPALRLSAAPFAEPIEQILAGERDVLLAIGHSGRLWQLTPGASAASLLGEGFDPASPLAAGYGRIAGRRTDASLGVIEHARGHASSGVALAGGAGVLMLADGVIAVEAADAGQRPLRLQRAAAGQWRAVARGRMPVLPDARALQLALDGEADGGHLLLLAGPDAQRYPHGALGDTIEATRIVYLERNSLVALRELTLPDSEVFEDIAPRRVVHDGAPALLSVVSGPDGGQLVLVGADRGDPRALAILARGEPIGTRFRWLAPSTDGRHWLAVHTPHLGGVLHEYRPQGSRLLARRLASGVSNHRLGSRVLDLASWHAGRVLMPDQAGTQLRLLDPGHDWQATAVASLPAAVVASLAMTGSARHAVLLQDGQVFFVAART